MTRIALRAAFAVALLATLLVAARRARGLPRRLQRHRHGRDQRADPRRQHRARQPAGDAMCPAFDTNDSGTVAHQRADRGRQRGAQRLSGRDADGDPDGTPTPTVGDRADLPGRLPRHLHRGARLPPQHRARRRDDPRPRQPDRRRALSPPGEPAAGRQHRDQGRVRGRRLQQRRRPGALAAMRKEAPGFDPEDGDWHWQRVEAPSRAGHVQRQGLSGLPLRRLPPRRRACLARDYMCTEDDTPRGTLRRCWRICPPRCCRSPGARRPTSTRSAPIPTTGAGRSCCTTTAAAGGGSTAAPPARCGGSASRRSTATSTWPARTG